MVERTVGFASEVRAAYERIKADIRRTPLERSGPLSREFGADVYVKGECDQTTGSFKLRGALNKIRSLSADERRRGVVSASTGNHGLAVNHAAKLEGVKLTLFLPENASPKKIALLRAATVLGSLLADPIDTARTLHQTDNGPR
ncbi:MAG: pyridoxal-phosphate dependent enzyme [Candidatus Aminicenantes bacterium]|nr:pyridoxal-phosphate dependent enzyme [Candidatus Aminicenantes bacterium]